MIAEMSPAPWTNVHIGFTVSGAAERSITGAATISIAAYLIIELEYPRVGLFRVDAMDQVLVELRESMD